MSATIAKALHEVMTKVGYVQKTGLNKFQNYKYAGEAQLLETLRPAMVEAGLILIPSVADVSSIDEHGITTVQIDYTLVHKDGDIWPEKFRAVGQGSDKNSKGVGDKGVYKATTGANKYVLFKLFQIETGDDPEKDDAPAKRENPHVNRPEDMVEDTTNNIPDSGEEVKETLTKATARKDFEAAQNEMRSTKTLKQLEAWGKNNSARLKAYPQDWLEIFRGLYNDHMKDLQGEAA